MSNCLRLLFFLFFSFFLLPHDKLIYSELRDLDLYIFNKFRFRISALNLNLSFPIIYKCTKMDQNGPKWSEWTEFDQINRIGLEWTK